MRMALSALFNTPATGVIPGGVAGEWRDTGGVDARGGRRATTLQLVPRVNLTPAGGIDSWSERQ